MEEEGFIILAEALSEQLITFGVPGSSSIPPGAAQALTAQAWPLLESATLWVLNAAQDFYGLKDSSFFKASQRRPILRM